VKPVRIKTVKLVTVFFLSILIILSSATALFIHYFPEERILTYIQKKAESSLERKISIGGLEYSIRGIVLKNVILHTGPSPDDPVFASAGEIRFWLSLFSLVHKQINLQNITVSGLRFNIIFDNKGVSNIEKISSDLNGTGSSSYSAKISGIRFIRAEISLINAPDRLRPLEGTYGVNARVAITKDRQIAIDQCTVKLPGKRGSISTDLKISVKKRDFKITGDVDLSSVSLLWVYTWGTRDTLPYNIVSGQVRDLSITRNAVSGNARLTSTLRNSDSILSADGGTVVDLKKRNVLLKNLNAGIGDSKLLINSFLFSFSGDILSFRTTGIDAQIKDIGPILKFIPAQLYGSVQGELSLEDKQYNGKLLLGNAGYDHENKTVSDLNAEISINDNIFRAADIPLKFQGQPALLSVASTDPSMKKLFVNLKMERINLKGTGATTAKKPVSLPVDINGIISIGRVEYGRIGLSGVQLNYTAGGSVITIHRLSAAAFSGNLQGSGVIDLSAKPPLARFTVEFGNMKVQEIASMSDNFRQRLFGIASGSAQVTFHTGTEILNTMYGKVEFNINRGKLVNTGIQNGLGVFLSELKYKLRDLEFNRIYGNVDIRGREYTINSFIFNSQSIRLNIRGDMDNNLVAKPLYINLEFTGGFIQDLTPAFVFGLSKYLEGRWYTIPFIQRGDLTESGNLKLLR